MHASRISRQALEANEKLLAMTQMFSASGGVEVGSAAIGENARNSVSRFARATALGHAALVASMYRQKGSPEVATPASATLFEPSLSLPVASSVASKAEESRFADILLSAE